ncbi:FAD-dependent oxidoreductase [Paracoccus cavernae]|uniref:FAD-dependent oxidoreductase n=1 Tax=Paracoccus cavernae TaxID=1571207 RepID=UPI00360D417F
MVGAMEQAGGDLVVLGGGPAGAVSAILGLRDGLRVTLVSPAPFLRAPDGSKG